MEGSKGASRGKGKWYTGKQSKRQRYEAYRRDCIARKQEVLGCEKLFIECWDAEKSIVETRKTGHGKCNECTQIGVVRDEFELRVQRGEEVTRQERTELMKREEIHRGEHRGERDYGDDLWHRATRHPYKITVANMDAPSQDQLEIPTQAKEYRDSAKGLETSPKWCSKLMAVMIAGVSDRDLAPLVMCASHAYLRSHTKLSVVRLWYALLCCSSTTGWGC